MKPTFNIFNQLNEWLSSNRKYFIHQFIFVIFQKFIIREIIEEFQTIYLILYTYQLHRALFLSITFFGSYLIPFTRIMIYKGIMGVSEFICFSSVVTVGTFKWFNYSFWLCSPLWPYNVTINHVNLELNMYQNFITTHVF